MKLYEVRKLYPNQFEFTAREVELDFNDFGYDVINGLIGLDLLMKAGYTIDLSKLQMNKSN